MEKIKMMNDLIPSRVAITQTVKGLLTLVPGWQSIRRREGGGASSARYCYAVWLRHLILARRSGLASHPEVVAEFGPGDSIGTGLAALLSGSRVYLALDVVRYTDLTSNLSVFEELVQLFRSRSSIPSDLEFPDFFPMQEEVVQDLNPRLESYQFPEHIFPAGQLDRALDEERVRAIRQILLTGRTPLKSPVMIRYVAPWNEVGLLEDDSVDLIFTQAVMEHVDQLDHAYRVMNRWLKPGGVISHEIDFKCHGIATRWNGHWAYPDILWRLIRGRRAYFLNRQTCGDHLESIRNSGFNIISVTRQQRVHGIKRADLCRSLALTNDKDLNTSSALIIASKSKHR